MKSVGIPIPSGENGLTTDDIAPVIAKALDLDASKVKDKLETKLPSGAQAGSATLSKKNRKGTSR